MCSAGGADPTCVLGGRGGRPAPGLSPQVEGEQQQEHELQRLREHLTMLLHVLLEARRPPLGPGEAGGWEAPQAAELLRRCEALEKKTATFENIVCVLNREVERVAMTAEACGRQHRLDQDRIKALSHKVCARGRDGEDSASISSVASASAEPLPDLFAADRRRAEGPWTCPHSVRTASLLGLGTRLRGWPRAASGARSWERWER